jgi:polysaccharide chain length determinant protein (PEP-CTERM system associated)
MNTGVQNPENASPRMEHHVTLVVRHRWWIIIPAFSFWALALAASLLMPSKFRSETVILIEQQKVLPQYVTPNVTIDLQQRMQSLTQQILSRTRLAKIIYSLHLYGKQPDQPASDELVQLMRKDITIELIKSGGHGDELSAFKVSYSAPTPALAQAVVGQITSLFIEENLRSQQQLSEDTTAFLDNQLVEARKDLERQEQLLGEFRSKYLGELPEQLSSNVQILSGLQSRLQSATGALHQAEQQRLYLASLIGQSKNLPHYEPAQGGDNSVSPSQPTALDDQIDKMQGELADLSARYTPRHPDVVRLKEQIAKLESIRREQSAGAKAGTNAAPSVEIRSRNANQQTISPIAQLESQLKANELEIANRKQEVKALEIQIEQYQGRLNLTPIREQQLTDVARNHEQSRANYESLLAKKLQSEMATDLAKRQQNGQFSVIDPPSLPQRPYWPDPLQFSLAGLVGGLIAGLAWVILKEVADPKVHSEEDMLQWSTAKVVAAIPPLRTHAEEKRATRRRSFEILVGSALGTVIPVVTVIAYLKY